ncbi:potassium channel family protein [Marinobacter bohaiensis]|uniref:potassium channel family protein n=1 Tax=Marinobacter bohaiensis TaxID=2201898 RepID=UPI0013A6ECEB|nr:potassium channel family protein [Marinobacter bohaiensis]
MAFTTEFLLLFFHHLLLAAPILGFLVLLILGLGLWAGRLERWPWRDALYWACITGTTVGYGDRVPVRGWARFLAIVIALAGLVLSGLIVAMAVSAGSEVFAQLQAARSG